MLAADHWAVLGTDMWHRRELDVLELGQRVHSYLWGEFVTGARVRRLYFDLPMELPVP